MNSLYNSINDINSNIDRHLGRDGTYFVHGCPDFIFFELQKELLRLRLQVEYHGAVRLFKSEDGGVSFPYYETIMTDKNINKIFNTYRWEVDDIDNTVEGGIYAVNVATKGTLPYNGYGLLFVRRIYDWIYQDLYYTFAHGIFHYHRKRINQDNWSDWFKYLGSSDLTEHPYIHRVYIDNEYVKVDISYCIHLNVCYVMLRNLMAKKIADPVLVYDGFPRAHMDNHLDFLNKYTGNWFGSMWLDENTTNLYCRFRKIDDSCWVSFSYPVRS